MSERFKKFKQELLISHIVKSVLAGLGVSLATVGGLLLLRNYEIIRLQLIFIILIGVGMLVLGMGAVFALSARSDMSVAIRLDRQFSLGERVQTMLQYQSDDGAILQLQREDTEKSLASADIGKLRFRKIWIYCIGLVMGAGILALGLVLKPAPTPPTPVIDIPFSITEIQKTALEELIEQVETSDMSSPCRENTAAHLDLLLEELTDATTVREKDAAISKATSAILLEIDTASCGLEIINALGASSKSPVLALAKAINFYDWTEGVEWDNFTAAMTRARAELIIALEEGESGDTSELLTALLTETGSAIPLSLRASGTSSDEALYIAVDKYASYINDDSSVLGIARLSGLVSELGYTEAQRRLDLLFAELSNGTFTSLEQHYTDISLGEFSVLRVCSLFGVSTPRFERPTINRAGEDNTPSGGNMGSGGGGIGVGTVYGSDDLVLDPISGEYVEYGKIIDAYYSKMFGKVQDGNYTEEEKKAMEKYFEILYGGFDEE